MKFISENEIKYVLSQKDKILESIHSQEKELLLRIEKETLRMDELQGEFIQARSLRGKQLSPDTISRTNNVEDYMLSMLESSEKMTRQYFKGLHEQFIALIQQEEICQRVIFCYECITGETKEILDAFFVKKEKWEYIEKFFQISHRTLVDKRKAAIKTLMDMYNNEFITLGELGKMRNGISKGQKTGNRKKKTNKDKNKLNGQLSLFDIRKD